MLRFFKSIFPMSLSIKRSIQGRRKVFYFEGAQLKKGA